MENSNLSLREQRRYQPQVCVALQGIGEKGQVRIKNSKVLVIGAGGKGTSAMKALMAAGVGYLGICDDALIREDTLSRQSLFNDNDIGKQKAIVSKQYLQERNSFTEIKVHNIKLTKSNIESTIADYDVLIDATNSIESHELIETGAKKLSKNLIIGHLDDNCAYLLKIEPDSNTKIPDQIRSTGENQIQDSETPTIIVNSLAGILLANEVLRTLLNKPSQLNNNMLIIKLSDYSFSLQPI